MKNEQPLRVVDFVMAVGERRSGGAAEASKSCSPISAPVSYLDSSSGKHHLHRDIQKSGGIAKESAMKLYVSVAREILLGLGVMQERQRRLCLNGAGGGRKSSSFETFYY